MLYQVDFKLRQLISIQDAHEFGAASRYELAHREALHCLEARYEGRYTANPKCVRVKDRVLYIQVYSSENYGIKGRIKPGSKRSPAPLPLPCDLGVVEAALRKSNFNSIVLGDNDAFQWMDSKYGTALAVLELISKLKPNHKVYIATRSDLIAREDYVTFLKHTPNEIFIEMIINPSYTEEALRLAEPGAPSIARRLKALRILQECGLAVRETQAG